MIKPITFLTPLSDMPRIVDRGWDIQNTAKCLIRRNAYVQIPERKANRFTFLTSQVCCFCRDVRLFNDAAILPLSNTHKHYLQCSRESAKLCPLCVLLFYYVTDILFKTVDVNDLISTPLRGSLIKTPVYSHGWFPRVRWASQEQQLSQVWSCHGL